MKPFGLMLLALVSLPAMAAWQFGDAISVTHVHGPKIFHHVESAGRKNVAAGGGVVAVTWEDNRSGVPMVYGAFKTHESKDFGNERQLSRKEAYEPAVVFLGEDRFLFAWQEAGRVWLRSATPATLGKPVSLAEKTSQVTLAAECGAIWAAWVRETPGGKRIEAARIRMIQDEPVVSKPLAVDSRPDSGDQLYPSIAIGPAGGVVVAWEDRRAGHTRIYSSGGIALNEVARTQDVYGRGPGAARVVLARYRTGIAAAWLDKRDFRSGYDVYAAIDLHGAGRFGANQKVQDAFGDTFSQWHAALAGNEESLVAVWDDNRDETADVFMSWLNPEGWSEDLAVPGASGRGEQREPSITADTDGTFHLVWVEQLDTHDSTVVRYLNFRHAQ